MGTNAQDIEKAVDTLIGLHQVEYERYYNELTTKSWIDKNLRVVDTESTWKLAASKLIRKYPKEFKELTLSYK